MEREKENILKRRISGVRKSMEEHGIEMFLVSKEENRNYLSMFYSTSFDIVIGREKNWLLTDFRYLEAAEESKPLFEVVQVSGEYGLNGISEGEEPAVAGYRAVRDHGEGVRRDQRSDPVL